MKRFLEIDVVLLLAVQPAAANHEECLVVVILPGEAEPGLADDVPLLGVGRAGDDEDQQGGGAAPEQRRLLILWI